VIERKEDDGRAWKCTLCYDRLKGDLEPACAKACPTDSIVFGDVTDLHALARERLSTLRGRGARDAQLYGIDEREQPGTQGLNAFFLLQERPEAYNLPPDPIVPTEHGKVAWRSAAAAMVALGVGIALAVAGQRR
jgi:formate dehydrogenase iron-sulfur subunit